MDKLNQRSEKSGDKKHVTDQKKFIELADKSSNGSFSNKDNSILSEFMQLRDAKFSKVTNDNDDVINDNTVKARANDNTRWRESTNSRLSKSSSTYSVKTANSANNGYSGKIFIS